MLAPIFPMDRRAVTDKAAANGENGGYLRRLGVWDTAMIVVGGVIGSGIFISPSVVAERTQTSAGVILAWAFGALFGIAGALCYAELGARRPQAGGTYVYLREAFGEFPAFLFGWIMLLINYPGCIAIGTITFARYTASALGYGDALIAPLSVGAIGALAIVNYTGIRSGATVQNVLTAAKFVAILAIIVGGLWIAQPLPDAVAAPAKADSSLLHFGTILMPVFFAYSGWAYANNIAAEIREPQRNIPRALVIGMLLVAACYLLANLAYLNVLGHDGLAQNRAPATTVMTHAFGEIGGKAIALGVAMSTLGFANICMIGGARVFQVMGSEGLFFRATGHLHPRFRTPDVAILVVSVWAIVLALSGTASGLLNYSNFADWLGYAGGAATLFYYRRRTGEKSAFLTPCHPWLPALFVALVLAILALTVLDNPYDAGIAALITLAGAPAYLFWSRTRQ